MLLESNVRERKKGRGKTLPEKRSRQIWPKEQSCQYVQVHIINPSKWCDGGMIINTHKLCKKGTLYWCSVYHFCPNDRVAAYHEKCGLEFKILMQFCHPPWRTCSLTMFSKKWMHLIRQIFFFIGQIWAWAVVRAGRGRAEWVENRATMAMIAIKKRGQQLAQPVQKSKHHASNSELGCCKHAPFYIQPSTLDMSNHLKNESEISSSEALAYRNISILWHAAADFLNLQELVHLLLTNTALQWSAHFGSASSRLFPWAYPDKASKVLAGQCWHWHSPLPLSLVPVAESLLHWRVEKQFQCFEIHQWTVSAPFYPLWGRL